MSEPNAVSTAASNFLANYFYFEILTKPSFVILVIQDVAGHHSSTTKLANLVWKATELRFFHNK